MVSQSKRPVHVDGLMIEDTPRPSSTSQALGTYASSTKAGTVVIGTDETTGTLFRLVEYPARYFFGVDTLHQIRIAGFQIGQTAWINEMLKSYSGFYSSSDQFCVTIGF